MALFPQLEKNICQFPLTGVVHEVGGGRFGAGIHSHVERSRQIETESAGSVVKLHRAQTEVGHNSVHRRQPAGGVQRVDLGEIPVLHDQLLAKARQPIASHFQCLGVAVQAQEPAASQALQDLLRVPPCPQRRVDVGPFRPDVEKIEGFTHEHGNMERPRARDSELGTRWIRVRACASSWCTELPSLPQIPRARRNLRISEQHRGDHCNQNHYKLNCEKHGND